MTWENILKKPFDAGRRFGKEPATAEGIIGKYLDPYVSRAFAEKKHAQASTERTQYWLDKEYKVEISTRAISGWPFNVLEVFSKLTKEKIERLYNINVIEFTNWIDVDLPRNRIRRWAGGKEFRYQQDRNRMKFNFTFTLKED